jgi:hypothetical protein
MRNKLFFITFPTSEGSDLLSSHVMQTPTFLFKLSDGNVIFRLDVGKTTFIHSNDYNTRLRLVLQAATFIFLDKNLLYLLM